MWFKILLTTWMAISVLMVIADVGKERKPITSNVASITTLIWAFFLVGLWILI